MTISCSVIFSQNSSNFSFSLPVSCLLENIMRIVAKVHPEYRDFYILQTMKIFVVFRQGNTGPATSKSVVRTEAYHHNATECDQKQALSSGFLFCGPRGVAKTTAPGIWPRQFNVKICKQTLKPVENCDLLCFFPLNNSSFNIMSVEQRQ